MPIQCVWKQCVSDLCRVCSLMASVFSHLRNFIYFFIQLISSYVLETNLLNVCGKVVVVGLATLPQTFSNKAVKTKDDDDPIIVFSHTI